MPVFRTLVLGALGLLVTTAAHAVTILDTSQNNSSAPFERLSSLDGAGLESIPGFAPPPTIEPGDLLETFSDWWDIPRRGGDSATASGLTPDPVAQFQTTVLAASGLQ